LPIMWEVCKDHARQPGIFATKLTYPAQYDQYVAEPRP
jgi:hypothetical protein